MSDMLQNKETDKKPRFKDLITDEVFEEHLKENNALCYISGTGSGKTEWVKEILITKGRALFVTSRKAKVNEDNKDDVFCSNLFKYNETNKSFLVTNSALARFIKSRPFEETKEYVDEFLKKLDYIVIDEIHSIICDSTFSRDVFTVKKFMEYAAFKKRMPVILLTATDQLIQDYLSDPIGKKECFWKCENFIKDSINTIPTHIVKVKNEFVTDTLIPLLVDKGDKFIYFLRTKDDADSIIDICCKKSNDKKGSIFIKNKLKKSDIIYFDAKTREKSDNLKKEVIEKLKAEFKKEKLEFDYNENGRLILKEFPEEKRYNKLKELSILYMSEKSQLPDNTKVLLATSALKEGISINNEDIKVVICYSHNLSDLLQYMGRVRKSAYTLYIIEDARQFPSKLSEVAYKFSENEGVSAANNYFANLSNKEKCEFIDYIETTIPYIRFNYINTRFELYTVLYNYHKYLDGLTELLKESHMPKWQKEMYDFFEKYALKIDSFKIDNTKSKYCNSQVKKTVSELLEDFGNRWLLFNEWKIPKKEIQTIFDLPNIKKDDPNKDLKERIKGTGINLKIKNKKERLKDSSGKAVGSAISQYWLEGNVE